MFLAAIVSLVLLTAAATAQAVAPVVPQHPLVMNGAPNGIYAYSYSNGSLFELIALGGGPGNTAPLNAWTVNRTPAAMAALGIINVAPSTYIAGYGYLTVQSSLSAVAQRLFYQTTNGNIVSAYHSGLTGGPGWVVDTTIATGLPLGTPISAFISVVTASRVVFHFPLYFHSRSEFGSPTYSKWRWFTTRTRVGVSLLYSQAWMWAAGVLLLRFKFEFSYEYSGWFFIFNVGNSESLRQHVPRANSEHLFSRSSKEKPNTRTKKQSHQSTPPVDPP
ncbi:hypothetical protein B0H19DRAFT_1332916 [Mycena capillaripes]|nr:hypothetical protein B0H19DRAFT_1332916 [Mycena capillaripes]